MENVGGGIKFGKGKITELVATYPIYYANVLFFV